MHADGEIWNGTQWQVRQALVKKWNARYPYADKELQERCAQGIGGDNAPLVARKCPGNRRWVQLMFDAFLLQQGATSMLDARDAMLAADRMRFDGDDQKVMWDAFAKRGMGKGASTPNADSGDVTPSFASPTSQQRRVTLASPSGTLYVGRYEARSTPIADTLGGHQGGRGLLAGPRALPDGARLGRPRLPAVHADRRGRRSAGRCGSRARGTWPPGATAPRVLSASDGSLNSDALIDGTEATNWAGVNDGTNVDAAGQHPFVVVDLAGGVQTVRRVQVSAMLRPAGPADPSDVPLAADPDSGSRFTALRRFALEACTSGCGSADATWKRFYTSSADAFPGARPRPVAPNLIMRGFDVRDTRAGGDPVRGPREPVHRLLRLRRRAGQRPPERRPTARRRRTAGSRCALRSSRSTDPALHAHRGDGQAPGPCPPPRCLASSPSPDP